MAVCMKSLATAVWPHAAGHGAMHAYGTTSHLQAVGVRGVSRSVAIKGLAAERPIVRVAHAVALTSVAVEQAAARSGVDAARA